jgi:hypothetical protein
MKSKAILLLTTLALALTMMAQSTTTPTAPATTTDSAKTCACCNHDQTAADKTDSQMTCCGKDGDCAKAGSCCKGDAKKCPMMSKNKDGKMACCADGKCAMMSKDQGGKGCCGGKMCARPQTGA